MFETRGAPNQTQFEILLVDDQRGGQLMLERALVRDDFQVVCKSSGMEALAYLEERVPDVMLLDVVMPAMDGLEVLRYIRRHHSALELPVIMVTARSEGTHIARALELGANDYITKPVDFKVAEARIRNQIKLKTCERDLVETAKRFELAIQCSSVGIWDWDLEADRIFYSTRWKEILGYGEAEIGDTPGEWFDRIHPEDRDLVQNQLDAHLRGETAAFDVIYRMCRKDGADIWVISRGAAQFHGAGLAYRLSGSHSNITKVISIDRHTGLKSGHFFKDRLSELMRHRREEGAHHTVMAVGLDQFDWLRDSLDDSRRHELLAEVGRRLQGVVGDRHLLSRYHTDRFLILRENHAGHDGVDALTQTIQSAFEQPFLLGGTEYYLTPAIGIAGLNGTKTKPDTVLRNAFAALAEAKREGKRRVRTFEKRLRVQASNILALETELRKALRRREFVLHYQPIVSLEDGRVAYCEALIRWNHPQKGMLYPASFIHESEALGLIGEIGEWVLREACGRAKSWQREGWPPVPVAVNFANFQFQQEGILALIQQILTESQLDPSMLKIELTENVLIQDLAHNAHLLEQLRAKGIQIMLDDFGTGYSSLSYLKHLPIDVLKIDQSFIQETNREQADDAVVMAIVQMARGLGMQTVCEGVERDDQVAMLMDMGCDYVQGYHFGKPRPGETFTDYLR